MSDNNSAFISWPALALVCACSAAVFFGRFIPLWVAWSCCGVVALVGAYVAGVLAERGQLRRRWPYALLYLLLTCILAFLCIMNTLMHAGVYV